MTVTLRSNQAQLRIKQNQEPKIQNYYPKKKSNDSPSIQRLTTYSYSLCSVHVTSCYWPSSHPPKSPPHPTIPRSYIKVLPPSEESQLIAIAKARTRLFRNLWYPKTRIRQRACTWIRAEWRYPGSGLSPQSLPQRRRRQRRLLRRIWVRRFGSPTLSPSPERAGANPNTTSSSKPSSCKFHFS